MEEFPRITKPGIRPVKMPNGTTVPLSGLKRKTDEEHAGQPRFVRRDTSSGITDSMSAIFEPDNRPADGNNGSMAGFQYVPSRPFENIATCFPSRGSFPQPSLLPNVVPAANFPFLPVHQNVSQIYNYPAFNNAYNCGPGYAVDPLCGPYIPMFGAQLNNAGQNYNFDFGLPAHGPSVPKAGAQLNNFGQNFTFDFDFPFPTLQATGLGPASPSPVGSIGGQTLVNQASSPSSSLRDDGTDVESTDDDENVALEILDEDEDNEVSEDGETSEQEFGGAPDEPVTIKDFEDGKDADYPLKIGGRAFVVDRVVLAHKASWFYETFMDDDEALMLGSWHESCDVCIDGWQYLKAFVHWLYNQPYNKAMEEVLPDLISSVGKPIDGLCEDEQRIPGIIRQPGTELKISDHGEMYLFAMNYGAPLLATEAAFAFKQLLEEKEAVCLRTAFDELRQFVAFTRVGLGRDIHDKLLLGVYVQDKLLQWMNNLSPDDEILEDMRLLYSQCHTGFFDDNFQGYNSVIEKQALPPNVVEEEFDDEDVEEGTVEGHEESEEEEMLRREA